MADTYSLNGDWSRINIFLPVNDTPEILAATRLIRIARNLYSGATHSVVRPHVFVGYWWDDEDPRHPQWIRDRICWLVLDAPYRIDQDELDIDVELLKLEALDVYQQLHSPQKTIWIIIHQAWHAP